MPSIIGTRLSRRNANLVDVEWFSDKVLLAVVNDDPVVVADALSALTDVRGLQCTPQNYH